MYGSAHIYAFLKTKQALSPGKITSLLFLFFLFGMCVAPIAVHKAEKTGLDTLARFIAYTGYLWMAFLFLFFCASISVDVFRIFIKITGIVRRDGASFFVSTKIQFAACLLFAFVATVYGYIDARDIRIKRVEIRSHKLPEYISRLRIVQISDVHIGLIIREERLAKIADIIKRAEPDILVSTGDLVDGQINNLDGLSIILKEIKTEYGKFAITGNHEYYAGINQAMSFIEKSGFTILRDKGISVGGIINIAGVDDPAKKFYSKSASATEYEILQSLPRGNFTLLLKHRPEIFNNSVGLFDLQLSGHVHNGQIFPFNLATKLYYGKISGYTSLSYNSGLYISSGTGTWGPPVRFLAPPEITILDIVRDS